MRTARARLRRRRSIRKSCRRGDKPYDKDGDGKLSETELAACPAMSAARDQYDLTATVRFPRVKSPTI